MKVTFIPLIIGKIFKILYVIKKIEIYTNKYQKEKLYTIH
jgi:hypothetical protein